MSKRDQYRVAILKKEFPFICILRVDGNPEDVNGIKVQKGDKNLLLKKGFEDSYSWSGGGHHDYTKYFAIWKDEEGGHEEIVELQFAGKTATGSGEHREWDADTIGEQLFARNISPDFIVECVQNDTDDNGNGELTRFWTIYKMQKFDLVAHHHQQIDRAAAVLKAEIAAACA